MMGEMTQRRGERPAQHERRTHNVTGKIFCIGVKGRAPDPDWERRKIAALVQKKINSLKRLAEKEGAQK